MDARGKLDIIKQGHVKAQGMIQQDLDRILCCVEALQSTEVILKNGGNTEAMLNEYHIRMHNTVVGTGHQSQCIWRLSSEHKHVPHFLYLRWQQILQVSYLSASTDSH